MYQIFRLSRRDVLNIGVVLLKRLLSILYRGKTIIRAHNKNYYILLFPSKKRISIAHF